MPIRLTTQGDGEEATEGELRALVLHVLENHPGLSRMDKDAAVELCQVTLANLVKEMAERREEIRNGDEDEDSMADEEMDDAEEETSDIKAGRLTPGKKAWATRRRNAETEKASRGKLLSGLDSILAEIEDK